MGGITSDDLETLSVVAKLRITETQRDALRARVKQWGVATSDIWRAALWLVLSSGETDPLVVRACAEVERDRRSDRTRRAAARGRQRQAAATRGSADCSEGS